MNMQPTTYGTRLTARENEILSCIVQGLKTSQIADRLEISKNTVANHRRNLLRKKGGRTIRQVITGKYN